MQKIYAKKSMPKYDFNKITKQLYWNHTSTWVFSCKLAACFPNTISQEHPWTAVSESGKSIQTSERVQVSGWRPMLAPPKKSCKISRTLTERLYSFLILMFQISLSGDFYMQKNDGQSPTNKRQRATSKS